MHQSAEAGQQDANGALASPTVLACRPSAISDKVRVAWVHYLVRPLGSVCVLLHPQVSMEVEQKRRQTEGGEVVGPKRTFAHSYILFYFIFIIVGF